MDYEDYIDTQKIGRKSSFKLFQNLKERHIIMFFILAGVGIILYNRDPENLKTIGLVGGGLFVYIFLQ